MTMIELLKHEFAPHIVLAVMGSVVYVIRISKMQDGHYSISARSEDFFVGLFAATFYFLLGSAAQASHYALMLCTATGSMLGLVGLVEMGTLFHRLILGGIKRIFPNA